MKIRKALKSIAIGFIGLLFLAVLGIAIWAKSGTYTAKKVALSVLESTETLSVTQDKWIVFEPNKETDIGLVFYPGGLVEPAAYAPILHQIAEEGVLVIITPMPFNLAILNTGAAEGVIEAYPQISTWVIAGHSLGGAAAAIFAENKPSKIDAIALWDSYPPDSADLSDNAISAISIYGTTNSYPNTDNFQDKKYLMPPGTKYIAIEGASHAQFGDYGQQKGDVVPSISMGEQHKQVVEDMLEFLTYFQE
jgi:hypothetical protein